VAKQFSIAVVLLGKDKASGPVGRALDKIGRKTVGTLNLVKGAGDLAGTALKGIGMLGVAAAGAGYAVGRLVEDYTSRVSELYDLSRQLGLTVEQLQELRYAAKISGVENLDQALSIFNRNIGQAHAGMGPLNKALERMAPGQRELFLAAKDNGQAFDMMMQAIASIENPADRAALAAAAFGKSGATMVRMVADGTAGLRAFREEARRAGLVTEAEAKIADEFGDNVDRLKFSLMGVVNAIGSRLLPVLQPLILRARDWVQANRELIATKVEQVIKKIGTALEKVGVWFEKNGDKLWTDFNKGVDKAIELVGFLAEHIEGVVTAVKLLAGTYIAGKLAGSLLAVIELATKFGTLMGLMAAAPAAAVVGAAAVGAGVGLAINADLARMQLAKEQTTSNLKRRLGPSGYQQAWERTMAGPITVGAGFGARRYGGKELFEDQGFDAIRKSLNVNLQNVAAEQMGTKIVAALQGAIKVVVDFHNVPPGVDVSRPDTTGPLTATVNVGKRILGWGY